MHITAGHQSLRKGRRSIAGQVYLLTTIAAERRPLFIEDEPARIVARCTVRQDYWGDARLLCWVLMPDHWHGLIELGEHDGISLIMNRFKSITSKRIRQTYATDAVWARGFHDHALRRDEDLTVAARYIVANPLRAGLVEHIGDYPYWNALWL